MKILKKQGVAWLITLVMIAAAIGIGYAKSARPSPGHGGPPPDSASSYVWDDAGVLSSSTKRTLNDRNGRLLADCDAVIGVATCNYGRDDLFDYAWKLAEEMGLSGNDMIVVLDVKGDNYCLLSNPDLLSDSDCTYYAQTYMERDFARGDYDGAALSITQALEDWYYGYN